MNSSHSDIFTQQLAFGLRHGVGMSPNVIDEIDIDVSENVSAAIADEAAAAAAMLLPSK